MTWLQTDDHTDEHPAYERLSDRAHRLHFAGLHFCARNATDGRIAKHRVRRLIPGAVKDDHIAELTAELWEDAGEEYVLTDFLGRHANKPRAWWESRRAADIARKSARNPRGIDAESATNPSARARVVPSPTQPRSPGMHIPRTQTENRARGTAAKSSNGTGARGSSELPIHSLEARVDNGPELMTSADLRRAAGMPA